MPAPPYSPYRRVGDLVTFSGLLGRVDDQPVAGLEAQLDVIFEQLDQRLADAGLQRRHVVKTTVWLPDLDDWDALNVKYLAYFEGVELPTRSTVGAQLRPGYLVELEAWAHASSR
jgi:2-iminobutanoate/2-iminopropanoate deaminase